MFIVFVTDELSRRGWLTAPFDGTGSFQTDDKRPPEAAVYLHAEKVPLHLVRSAIGKVDERTAIDNVYKLIKAYEVAP